MFKFILHFLPLLLFFSACGEIKEDKPLQDSIPELKLPLKMKCDDFPGIRDSLYFANVVTKADQVSFPEYLGKITQPRFTVLIKNKSDIQSPVLFTIAADGKTIDSLRLFEKECFIGTDSHYNPWIEITNGLQIMRTDTQYSILYEFDTAANCTSEIFNIHPKVYTEIAVNRFEINYAGKIIERDSVPGKEQQPK